MADEYPLVPNYDDAVPISEPPIIEVVDSIPILPAGADAYDGSEDDPANAGQGYWGYGQVVSRIRDRGLRPQPVAGPSGVTLTRFVRVHAGYCKKIINGVAIRALTQPQPPPPESQSPNEVLLFDTFTNFNPQPMLADGKLFGCVWHYEYGLQAMPGPADLIDSSKAPNDPTDAALYALDPANYSQHLIGVPASVTTTQTINPIAY